MMGKYWSIVVDHSITEIVCVRMEITLLLLVFFFSDSASCYGHLNSGSICCFFCFFRCFVWPYSVPNNKCIFHSNCLRIVTFIYIFATTPDFIRFRISDLASCVSLQFVHAANIQEENDIIGASMEKLFPQRTVIIFILLCLFSSFVSVVFVHHIPSRCIQRLKCTPHNSLVQHHSPVYILSPLSLFSLSASILRSDASFVVSCRCTKEAVNCLALE